MTTPDAVGVSCRPKGGNERIANPKQPETRMLFSAFCKRKVNTEESSG